MHAGCMNTPFLILVTVYVYITNAEIIIIFVILSEYNKKRGDIFMYEKTGNYGKGKEAAFVISTKF